MYESKIFSDNKMNKSLLSIIIVNYNTGPLLYKCLHSIQRNIKNIKYEIIVVDNNSTDNSWVVTNELDNCILVKNKSNRGFCIANNQALKKIQSRFILLLNPDTELTTGAIEKMLKYLNYNQKVGIVGPKVLYPNGKLQYTAFCFPTVFTIFSDIFFLNRLFPTSKIFNKKDLGYWGHNNIREVDAVSGCCLLLKKRVYDDIGGLDENLFFMDDIDFCKRTKNKTWKVIYFPKSVIYHHGGMSSSGNRYARVYFRRKSRILYFKKYYSRLTVFSITLLTFGEMVLRIPIETIIYLVKRAEENKTRLKAYFKVINFILVVTIPKILKTSNE